MNDVMEVIIWYEHWGRDAMQRWEAAQRKSTTTEPVLSPEQEQEHLKYLAEQPSLPF